MNKKKSIAREGSTLMKKNTVRNDKKVKKNTVMKGSTVMKKSAMKKRKTVKREMMKKWNSLMRILVALTTENMMKMKHKTLKIQSLKVLKKAGTRVKRAAFKKTCKVTVKAFMKKVKIVARMMRGAVREKRK